jgi:hypothetical protein
MEILAARTEDHLPGLESSNARKRCSISTNLTPHFAHRPHVTGGNDSLSRPRLLLLPHGQPCSSPLRESVDTKAFLTFRSRGKTDVSRCCRRGKACLHPAGSQSSFTRAEEMPGARFAHAGFPLTGIMGAICSSTRSTSVTFTGIRYEGCNGTQAFQTRSSTR